MPHCRKYTVALVGSDSRLTCLLATRLTLVEAAAWLDSHRRAPAPEGQPCILLQPLAAVIHAASVPPRP